MVLAFVASEAKGARILLGDAAATRHQTECESTINSTQVILSRKLPHVGLPDVSECFDVSRRDN